MTTAAIKRQLKTILSSSILGVQIKQSGEVNRNNLITLLAQNQQVVSALQDLYNQIQESCPNDLNTYTKDDPCLGDFWYVAHHWKKIGERKRGAVTNFLNVLFNSKPWKLLHLSGRKNEINIRQKFFMHVPEPFHEQKPMRGGESYIGQPTPSDTSIRHETEKKGDALIPSNLSREQGKGELEPSVHPDALMENQALPKVVSIQDAMTDIAASQPDPKMNGTTQNPPNSTKKDEILMKIKPMQNISTTQNSGTINNSQPPHHQKEEKQSKEEMMIEAADSQANTRTNEITAHGQKQLNVTAYMTSGMSTGRKATMGGTADTDVLAVHKKNEATATPDGQSTTKVWNPYDNKRISEFHSYYGNMYQAPSSQNFITIKKESEPTIKSEPSVKQEDNSMDTTLLETNTKQIPNIIRGALATAVVLDPSILKDVTSTLKSVWNEVSEAGKKIIGKVIDAGTNAGNNLIKDLEGVIEGSSTEVISKVDEIIKGKTGNSFIEMPPRKGSKRGRDETPSDKRVIKTKQSESKKQKLLEPGDDADFATRVKYIMDANGLTRQHGIRAMNGVLEQYWENNDIKDDELKSYMANWVKKIGNIELFALLMHKDNDLFLIFKELENYAARKDFNAANQLKEKEERNIKKETEGYSNNLIKLKLNDRDLIDLTQDDEEDVTTPKVEPTPKVEDKPIIKILPPVNNDDEPPPLEDPRKPTVKKEEDKIPPLENTRETAITIPDDEEFPIPIQDNDSLKIKSINNLHILKDNVMNQLHGVSTYLWEKIKAVEKNAQQTRFDGVKRETHSQKQKRLVNFNSRIKAMLEKLKFINVQKNSILSMTNPEAIRTFAYRTDAIFKSIDSGVSFAAQQYGNEANGTASPPRPDRWGALSKAFDEKYNQNLNKLKKENLYKGINDKSIITRESLKRQGFIPRTRPAQNPIVIKPHDFGGDIDIPDSFDQPSPSNPNSGTQRNDNSGIDVIINANKKAIDEMGQKLEESNKQLASMHDANEKLTQETLKQKQEHEDSIKKMIADQKKKDAKLQEAINFSQAKIEELTNKLNTVRKKGSLKGLDPQLLAEQIKERQKLVEDFKAQLHHAKGHADSEREAQRQEFEDRIKFLNQQHDEITAEMAQREENYQNSIQELRNNIADLQRQNVDNNDAQMGGYDAKRGPPPDFPLKVAHNL